MEDSIELNGLSKLTTFSCLTPVHRNKPVETNETKSVRIINCNALESFSARSGCFADFGHFEVSNCPALTSLSFIYYYLWSYTFIGSSFSVRGRNYRGFLLVDCPSLESLWIEDGSFNQSLTTVMESSNQAANYDD